MQGINQNSAAAPNKQNWKLKVDNVCPPDSKKNYQRKEGKNNIVIQVSQKVVKHKGTAICIVCSAYSLYIMTLV
jgi:hypothetical protein